MSAAARTLRTEAVVLYHWDYGEADRMIGLYTREAGKVSALAKGVRKTHSRKAGHLEPFTCVSLLLNRGQSLYLVSQAETVNAYLPLREDLVALGLASYVLELVDRFTYEGEENQAIYRTLTNTLLRLTEKEDRRLVLRYFEMRLLDASGFRPKLFLCAACQGEIQAQDQFFSAEMGGVLCPRCGARHSGTRPVSMLALKYLRHFQRSNYLDAEKARPDDAAHREMETLMQHYITYVLERRLNTPAFLRRLEAERMEADRSQKNHIQTDGSLHDDG